MGDPVFNLRSATYAGRPCSSLCQPVLLHRVLVRIKWRKVSGVLSPALFGRKAGTNDVNNKVVQSGGGCTEERNVGKIVTFQLQWWNICTAIFAALVEAVV